MSDLNIKELRIGSLVTLDHPDNHPKLKGVTLKVDGIGRVTGNIRLKHISDDNEVFFVSMRHVKPIPINYKCLDLLEWEHNDLYTEECVYKKGYYTYYINQQFVYNNNAIVRNDVKYVHDLQNIMMALRIEKVTINGEPEDNNIEDLRHG